MTQAWRGDASTNHLFSELAAENIKLFCPSARILVMLRPPVDWMRSYHSELLRHQHEDIADFYEAVNASEDRRNGLRLPPHTSVPKCLDYLEMSRFAPQVERYYRVFGRGAVKVVLLEDMVAAPEETLPRRSSCSSVLRKCVSPRIPPSSHNENTKDIPAILSDLSPLSTSDSA